MMTYGLVPVGGKGLRLSLPFSKEMLPQKNYDYYNPLINHVVEKMLLAGVEKVYFIHGDEFKKDLKDFFNENKYIHVLQKTTGFANVIEDFYQAAKPEDGDKILFGLPDSIFNKNPFVRLLNEEGVTCGLFETEDCTKVDRLDLKEENFQVKTEKNDSNLNLFWGVLKFDGKNIRNIIEDKHLENISEIGEILNLYPKKFIKCGEYLDLGTWENFNKYLNSNNIEQTEIEVKYNAELVSEKEFCELLESHSPNRYIEVTSLDHYFSSQNPNVEFVRYREGDGKDARSDLTIKNFKNSAFNRFELEIPIEKNVSPEDVIYFLSLMNANFLFSIDKTCHIFWFDKYIIVLYSFVADKKEYKILEVELREADFNLISEAENLLSNMSGFSKSSKIKESKFQIIKKALEI